MAVPDSAIAAARWSLDHLFLDQDGVPTLVEVKRNTDTRIRREVVGQMLDYAANAVVYWPIEDLRRHVEAGSESEEDRLISFLGPSVDRESFWATVETNLRGGRIRLVFVADVIPNELRRIIEFLNGQMRPAEVLAIEIRQFVGGPFRTLIPRVIGQTAETEQRKRTGASFDSSTDEEAYFADLTARQPPEVVAGVRAIRDWTLDHSYTRFAFRKAQGWQSFWPCFDYESEPFFPINLRTDGKVELDLATLSRRAQFSLPAVREELLRRLSEIDGVSIGPALAGGKPKFEMSVLRAEHNRARLYEVLEWIHSRATGRLPAAPPVDQG
jgi:hypothetical protein